MRALAILTQQLGDLERIHKVLRINVYVRSAEDFTQQSEAADGASEVLYAGFSPRPAYTHLGGGCTSSPRAPRSKST